MAGDSGIDLAYTEPLNMFLYIWLPETEDLGCKSHRDDVAFPLIHKSICDDVRIYVYDYQGLTLSRRPICTLYLTIINISLHLVDIM